MTGFSAVKAIVFDMDGVIIDSEPMHHKATMLTLSRFGINVTEEELHPFIGVSGETYHKTLVTNHGLTAGMAEFISEYDKAVEEVFASGYPEVKGARDLIGMASEKGLKIGLASSSSPHMIHDVLFRLGIADFFDAVVSGRNVNNGKPAPDIYLEAAERLSTATGDCVAIEDAAAGVASAKAAGMRVIGFDNPNSRGQDITAADAVVKTMEEAKRLLFS